MGREAMSYLIIASLAFTLFLAMGLKGLMPSGNAYGFSMAGGILFFVLFFVLNKIHLAIKELKQ